MGNTSGELQRVLTFRHIVFFGLAFMAPQTLFATYGIVAVESNGMVATGYMIALIVMLFTAFSYAQLVKAFPSAGAAYTFTQKAINPYLGFLVGWVILLDYMLSPMISALLLGIALSAYFPAIPIYVWIILFIAVITIVNVRGIKFAANFNTYVFLLQLLIFVFFFIFAIKYLLSGGGTGTLFSIQPFLDQNVEFSSLIAVVPILCFTFLGFDAITALSEETKDPKKTLPKAIYAIPLIGGFLYITSSYLLHMVHPNVSTFVNPDSAYLEIASDIGGIFLNSAFTAVALTAGFASAVASGSSAARILYAMGRENILPRRIFGYVSPKYKTPVYNILIVAIVALSALFFNLDTATSFITFGAFFAFVFVNLSVISHYFIKKGVRTPKGIIQYLIIPLIGAIFIFVLLLGLNFNALILGGVWLIIGFLYLMNQTKLFKQPPPEIFEEKSEIIS
ncbi:APC family permease [Siminovitchia fortis]|uniref:APC family permease n=1 Tax=Siminovitchia fortis TaxID=254758 RepID=A0A443IKE8_9BACI|nr:APC family permease [Siminovitchia fortis]RWR05287.1 APC family permease [Siminovitchia fortis]WHY82434.1 APC family permease [Siminovitchia fortis]